MHANFSNLHGAPVRRMGRPPRTLSRAWRLGFTRIGEEERRDGEAIAEPAGPTAETRWHTAAQHTPATPDGLTNRRDGRQHARHMQQMPGEWRPAFATRGVKHARKPTTSSYNPPGQGHASRTPRPTCSRERGGTTPGHVLPPHPPLPRAGSTRGRAKGPAKYTEPAAGPITTRMLTNHRPEYYRPGRASGDKCTAGTSAHLRRGVGRLGRVRLRHV